VFLLKKGRRIAMTEMNKEMQKCFDKMSDKQKIRMFYELTKYMHENMEYGEDEDMNNLIENIANVKNDIENL
jgi:hypothetical protein